MKARDADGRFRNHNRPLALSASMIRSRWVEGEVLRLKRLGFSYEAIAQQISDVGRGHKAPVTSLPEDVSFPADYKITKITAMGCHKALTRALRRAPKLEVDEMRRLDSDRLEEMLLSLWPAIRQGDPQSVRAAVQVLAHKAAINGYRGSDTQVSFAAETSWAAVMTKDQTVTMVKDAITILVKSGITISEMAQVSGVELPAIETDSATIHEDQK